MAMLAKLGWRILQNPESLCSRILKAKYFPNTSVLLARHKSDMSYTWRRIIRGIELLNKGIIWRVGDGHNLNIWTDPWLSRDGTRKPITPRNASLLCDVSDLVNPNSRTWDDVLVKDTFGEEDVKLILPLMVHEGRENRIAWHYDSRGLFQ
jgi:hypothetical protein